MDGCRFSGAYEGYGGDLPLNWSCTNKDIYPRAIIKVVFINISDLFHICISVLISTICNINSSINTQAPDDYIGSRTDLQ